MKPPPTVKGHRGPTRRLFGRGKKGHGGWGVLNLPVGGGYWKGKAPVLKATVGGVPDPASAEAPRAVIHSEWGQEAFWKNCVGHGPPGDENITIESGAQSHSGVAVNYRRGCPGVRLTRGPAAAQSQGQAQLATCNLAGGPP
eukprot:525397-Hanusia_phi.AAC.7